MITIFHPAFRGKADLLWPVGGWWKYNVGRNVSNETKWGEKRLGYDVQNGASTERNVNR